MTEFEDKIRVPVFDGRDFGLWKKRMLVALKAKKLRVAIEPKGADGKVKCSDLEDSQALMLMLNSIDRSVGQKVLACETASDVWERLQQIYENSGSINVGQLLERYYSYRKDSNDDMSTHIGKVEALAIQLEQVGQKQSEESVMTKLLQSLPEKYESLKEAWASVHPDHKTRDGLVERMLRYDGLPKVSETKEVALVAGQVRRKGPPRDKSKIKCFNCQKLGHIARECRSEKKPRPQKGDKAESSTGVALIVDDKLERSSDWIVDSGASRHTCCRRDWFQTFSPTKEKLQVGNEETVEALGTGTIKLECQVGSRKSPVTLQNVLYIPEMSYNLFSTGQAAKRGAKTVLSKQLCKILVANKTVAIGELDENTNLYILKTKTILGVSMLVSTRRSLDEWHHAFGHADPRVIQQMVKSGCVEGLEVIKKPDLACELCPEGKATRASHNLAPAAKPSKVGDQVDLDLIGPISEPSLAGAHYIMLARDSFSKFSHVYMIKTKDEALECLQNYIGRFEAESGKRIATVRTDNGSEFNNAKVETLFALEHIKVIYSAPHTKQQNGGAERNNRTIVETTRTMLMERQLPPGLWAEAVSTAVYLRNRVPSGGHAKTPFELFIGRKPFVGHLVAFGTSVQVLINERRVTKFEPKTEPGFVVGFTDRSNTYRVYMPKGNRVKISCDVIFRTHSQVGGSSASYTWAFMDAALPKEQRHGTRAIDDYFEQVQARGGRLSSSEPAQPEQIDSEEEIESPEFSPWTVNGDDEAEERVSRHSPSHQGDAPAGAYEPRNQGDVSVFSGRSLPRTPPQSPRANPDRLLTCRIAPSSDPASYKQAMSDPQAQRWKEAVGVELKALEKNKTWVVAPRPINGSVLSTKWVFTTKRDSTGRIEKFKARLVVRGFEQREGVDVFDTFAPVVRTESIRVLIAVAAATSRHIERFDVSSAFLNGEVTETVYIEFPEGLPSREGKCLQLKKALYGLRQAPKVWNSTFDLVAKEIGFKPTKLDPCVYIREQTNVFMAVYVDDGLVIGPDELNCVNAINELNKRFEVKRILGDMFLGMKMTKLRGGIHLSQGRYAGDILARFKMQECMPMSLPLVDTRILFEQTGEAVEVPYRAAIGSLMYMALATRPDLLFPTTLLSRFNEKPLEVHWSAVKRIMKYVKSTLDLGLMFEGPKEELTVEAYCDADWGGDQADRKSTTGIIILVCGSPVIFVSRKQSIVAMSSCEAEYVAASEAIKEIAWLMQLFGELQLKVAKPILHIDNMGAIWQIKNQDSKRRSKHIDIKYHYARDMYKRGLFNLQHVPSAEQRADFLTKRLGKEELARQLALAGVRSNRQTKA